MKKIEPALIVETIEKIANRPRCPDSVSQRALTAYAKLSCRLASYPDICNRLEKLLKKYKGAHSVETQIRSCEYDILIRLNGSKEALARMPAVDIEVMQRNQKLVDSFVPTRVKREGGLDLGSDLTNGTGPKSAESGLLDLDDIFGSAPPSSQPAQPIKQQETKTSVSTGPQSDVDLLSDIFSSPPAPTPSVPAFPASTAPVESNAVDMFGLQPAIPSQPISQQNQSSSTANPLDMYAQPSMPTMMPSMPNMVPNGIQQQTLSSVMPSSTLPVISSTSDNLFGDVSAPTSETISVLEKDGLVLEFECSKVDSSSSEKSKIVAKFGNKSGATIVGLNLQCAVPKFVKMEMQPPTSTTLSLSSSVTQTINVTNTMLANKNLMMKIKVSFTINGNKFEHMTTCSSFPSGY